MKYPRLVGSLLPVLMFLGNSVSATTPPPTGTAPSEVRVRVETTPVHHVAHSGGPIIVNWRLKNGQGQANVLVNPDGTYLFSGNYTRKEPGKILDLALLLKSKKAGVYMFRYVGDVSRGGVRWSTHGKSAILKDDFKDFAPGHDWAGTYGFSLTAEGREQQRKYQLAVCHGQYWGASQADYRLWQKYEWQSGSTMDPKFCVQYGL